GYVPAGSECRELAATFDLLPTIAARIDAALPPLPIDGVDLSPWLRGEAGAHAPHEAFYCWYDGQLRGVRSGKWKLALPHRYATLGGKDGGRGGRPAPYVTKATGLSLYDLESDPGEQRDVAAEHPDVVERLQQLATAARVELGDKDPQVRGRAVRAVGRLDDGDARLRW
ncbi:MAG: arylsulfatase, partial [Planctomycetota bacterium]